MTGTFAQFQPRYAAIGISTFPFIATEKRKRPLVRGYDRIGLPASGQLVMKGLDGDGLACMAGERNKLTVIDIDAHGAEGERLLADMQCTYGASRFIVSTGSGGFHAYYRHNGESRRIRPDPRKPVDLLGGGVVVLPPSRGVSRHYEIIHGNLDDLAALTPIRHVIRPPTVPVHHADAVIVDGRRNSELFRILMRAAHHCDDLESLIDVARTRNAECLPPLDDAEVVKIAMSAWGYTERGQNRFGQTGAWFPTDEANTMIASDQDAFLLLAFLRANNGPQRAFMVANGLAERLGWTRKRLAGARRRLEQSHIMMVRHASEQNGAALYRWKPKMRDWGDQVEDQVEQGEGVVEDRWSELTTLMQRRGRTPHQENGPCSQISGLNPENPNCNNSPEDGQAGYCPAGDVDRTIRFRLIDHRVMPVGHISLLWRVASRR